jgi:hypothetical protein
MFMTVEAYLKRLTSALENAIAPEIESDRTRGQVFAIIGLLDQLATRIEYKPGLLAEEIDAGEKLAREVAAAAGGPSAALAALLREAETQGPGRDLPALARVDEMLSLAIEEFFAAGDRMSVADRARTDQLIRDHLTRIATRDLGLTKPPNFEKISRSKRGQ